MSALSTNAIVLQVFPYGETSKILRLLTETHGLQSAIARGARRPRSRFGGILEPFAQGLASLHFKETRELQTLTGFELAVSRQALGSDLLRFGGASFLTEIVLRTAHEEPQPGLYSLVAAALDDFAAAAADRVETMILAEVWRLIACLGFTPELEQCIDCGAALGSEHDELRFDYAAGGLRCPDCGAGAPGRTLPARAIHALRAMIGGNVDRLDTTRGHWWLLTRYLEHHVLEGSTLHSLAFVTVARGTEACED